MPEFRPFRGLRFDEAIDLNATCSPPYDVIGEAERDELSARTPYNIVHIDLPIDRSDGEDPYARSARLMNEWQQDRVLVTDDMESFYIYRMGFHDEQGQARQTTGVIGALKLSKADQGEILPHEHTTPKAKSDRLDLIRATRANLSPIWGLSLATGLSDLCEPTGPPVGRATDAHGVHHRIWQESAPAVLEAISEAVASTPLVVADGHHRFETSLIYRDERRGAASDAPGPYDSTMALINELTDSQLSVRAIHRLFRNVADSPASVLDALERWFEIFEVGIGSPKLLAQMEDDGALALVAGASQAWLMRPRHEAFPPETPDLDSARIQVAMSSAFPNAEVTYQHGVEIVLDRLDNASEGFDIAVLLRPVGLSQIAACAHGGERMPPKSTYFYPKPLTGMVLRKLDD